MPKDGKKAGILVGLAGVIGGILLLTRKAEAHPENIILSNLVIEPGEVYTGEPVSISATATNIGTEPATKQITCEVGSMKKMVTLNPGESKVVSFQFIPQEVRIYQVSVDGLSGSFSAIAAPVLPSIKLIGFHYVWRAQSTWSLTDRMIHGQDITHIGVVLRNDEVADVPSVSLKFRIIDGGGRELSPALDQYLRAMSQPFTLAPGSRGIFYSFTPAHEHYRAEAEIWAAGQLVDSRAIEFDVTYD